LSDYANSVQLNPLYFVDQWLQPERLDEAQIGAPLVKLAVPKDFQALKRHDMELARAWRGFSADTFTTLFANHYSAIDLLIADDHCTYIFAHQFVSG
jgi:predicted GNAT superfamily acetyltransferase